jgi:hypothetical protein
LNLHLRHLLKHKNNDKITRPRKEAFKSGFALWVCLNEKLRQW